MAIGVAGLIGAVAVMMINHRLFASNSSLRRDAGNGTFESRHSDSVTHSLPVRSTAPAQRSRHSNLGDSDEPSGDAELLARRRYRHAARHGQQISRRTRLPRVPRRSTRRTFSRTISGASSETSVCSADGQRGIRWRSAGLSRTYGRDGGDFASLGGRRLVLRCSFEPVRQPTAPQWQRRAEGEVSAQTGVG